MRRKWPTTPSTGRITNTIQSAITAAGIRILGQRVRVVPGLGPVTSLAIYPGDVSDTGSYALNLLIWGRIHGK